MSSLFWLVWAIFLSFWVYKSLVFLPARLDLGDAIMPMAITRSLTSSFIRAQSHSPRISLKLEKAVFIEWRKLGIIFAPPTRRSYRAGAQVRREYALKQFLPLGYVNARSIRNKIPRLQQHIESLDLDVLAITETWAKSAEDGDDLLR